MEGKGVRRPGRGEERGCGQMLEFKTVVWQQAAFHKVLYDSVSSGALQTELQTAMSWWYCNFLAHGAGIEEGERSVQGSECRRRKYSACTDIPMHERRGEVNLVTHSLLKLGRMISAAHLFGWPRKLRPILVCCNTCSGNKIFGTQMRRQRSLLTDLQRAHRNHRAHLYTFKHTTTLSSQRANFAVNLTHFAVAGYLLRMGLSEPNSLSQGPSAKEGCHLVTA